MTRGQLPQRAGSLGLNGGGTATAVPPNVKSVMEEIFEIRSCIEILANDIKVNTADEYNYALQLAENCKVYILEDLHPSGGKNVLNMCDFGPRASRIHSADPLVEI